MEESIGRNGAAELLSPKMVNTKDTWEETKNPSVMERLNP